MTSPETAGTDPHDEAREGLPTSGAAPRELAALAFVVLGATAVIGGVAAVSLAAAVIVAGGLLLALGLLLGLDS